MLCYTRSHSPGIATPARGIVRRSIAAPGTPFVATEHTFNNYLTFGNTPSWLLSSRSCVAPITAIAPNWTTTRTCGERYPYAVDLRGHYGKPPVTPL